MFISQNRIASCLDVYQHFQFVSSTLFDAFSGGLLFPWHIGVLSGLAYNNALDDSNPLAGSSAGSIAVASHGAGVKPEGKKIYESVSHII